jgi:hypothetical protein
MVYGALPIQWLIDLHAIIMAAVGFPLYLSGGSQMQDPSCLREQARKCRLLSNTAIEPEVIEQLRVWSVELAEEADKAEWSAAEGDETIVMV